MKMNLCSFLISQNFSFLKTSLFSKEKDEEEELHHHLYHTWKVKSSIHRDSNSVIF